MLQHQTCAPTMLHAGAPSITVWGRGDNAVRTEERSQHTLPQTCTLRAHSAKSRAKAASGENAAGKIPSRRLDDRAQIRGKERRVRPRACAAPPSVFSTSLWLPVSICATTGCVPCLPLTSPPSALNILCFSVRQRRTFASALSFTLTFLTESTERWQTLCSGGGGCC